MTGAELTEIREAMRWSRQNLADWIGCSQSLVRDMEYGKREVPYQLAGWLTALEKWVQKHPPPLDWRWWVETERPAKGSRRIRANAA